MTEQAKKEILRKALIGVCKDMDAMFTLVGEEANVTKQMKERLALEGDKVIEEIMQDPEIAKQMEEWMKQSPNLETK